MEEDLIGIYSRKKLLKGIKLSFSDNTIEIRRTLKSLFSENELMHILNTLSIKKHKEYQIYDYSFLKINGEVTLYKFIKKGLK